MHYLLNWGKLTSVTINEIVGGDGIRQKRRENVSKVRVIIESDSRSTICNISKATGDAF